MRSYKLILAVVAATFMAAGCSQQKQNATKVLEGVEAKLAPIKADANGKYPVPMPGLVTDREYLS